MASDLPFRIPVVITAAATSVACASREEAAVRVPNLAEAWDLRIAQLEQALTELGCQDTAIDALPSLGVYYDDPIAQLPSAAAHEVPLLVLDVSRRIALHLAERLTTGQPPLPRASHVSLGSPETDISVADIVTVLQLQVPQKWQQLVSDPISWLAQCLPGGNPSVGKVVEASASGDVATSVLADRIASGGCEAGLVLSTNGYTFPAPFERARVGVLDDRTDPPFTDESHGHFTMEGGAGLTLRSLPNAEQAGARVLARLLGWRHGSMGASVVNRAVVARTVEELLTNAAVDRDEPVLVSVYGRGNRIDDGAELAIVEMLAETRPGAGSAYLKKGLHYVVGSHGLMGLARVLEATAAGTDPGSLAQYDFPRSIAASRKMPHFDVDPAAAKVVVTLSYSAYGTYNVLVTRTGDSR